MAAEANKSIATTGLLTSVLGLIQFSKTVDPSNMTGSQKFELLQHGKMISGLSKTASEEVRNMLDEQKDQVILNFGDELFKSLSR